MTASADTTIVSFPGLGIDSFEINRYLTQDLFGKGISIAWYGVLICLGMIAAYFIIRHFATKREGINLDSLLDYLIFMIPLGVIGARAMYVLTNLDYYDSFSKAIAVWEGGLAIYGGVLTGILVVLVVSRIKKINPLKVYDAIVPGLMLAQAIGRWGNFINGEAHGSVTSLPWRMMINGEGPFHPTFLYESLITLTGCFIAIFVLYRRKKFDGEIFYFYLIWYGIGRTLVESLRTDSLYFGALKASQCIGIGTALIGALLLIFTIVRAKQGKPALFASGEPAVTIPEKAEPEGTEESGKNEGTSDEEKTENAEESQSVMNPKNTEDGE